MDIGKGKPWPSHTLSNFAPHPFVIDGVECASMEGFLQSLKFDKPHIQIEVCKLVGLAAKRRGRNRNRRWKPKQTLWWKGVAMARDSKEYQDLLDRAFDALAENKSFQRALLATGNAVLKHNIGKRKKQNTVLTRQEFVSRLTKIRVRLQKEKANGQK